MLCFVSQYEKHYQPIVVMSPVVKLREDHNFAFGARWALVQNHAWRDRSEFIQMGDEEVKTYFREWVESDTCPWYVCEQYYEERSDRGSGRRVSVVAWGMGSWRPTRQADKAQGRGAAGREGFMQPRQADTAQADRDLDTVHTRLSRRTTALCGLLA